jgi:hypothetical protein
MGAVTGWITSPGLFSLGNSAGKVTGDGAECTADSTSQTLHGSDCAQRNQGSYESVLNEVLSGFIAEQILPSGGIHFSFLQFDYPSKTVSWWHYTGTA